MQQKNWEVFWAP